MRIKVSALLAVMLLFCSCSAQKKDSISTLILKKLPSSAFIERKTRIVGNIDGELLEIRFTDLTINLFSKWATAQGVSLEPRNIFSNLDSVPTHWMRSANGEFLSGFLFVDTNLKAIFMVTPSNDSTSLIGYFYCYYK